ncbi:MAG: chemotaxis protein CheC [Armatimonadetes bacterium]|nr:chemotaxis protein CheC [Armatimonadota bacterium]
MMENFTLSPMQLDALKELGNISAGNAATAFSQMVNRKVDMDVPQVQFVPLDEVGTILGENTVRVGLYQKILGKATGSILIMISRSSAFELIDLVAKRKDPRPRILTPVDEDLLKELANILSGCYLTTLSQMTGFLLMPSVPNIAVDVGRAIVDYLTQINPEMHVAFVIYNELVIEQSSIMTNIFLFPNPNCLEIILKSLGLPQSK